MKLISILCVIGWISGAASYGCDAGWTSDQLTMAFMNHVGTVFFDETSFYTIAYEYDVWYNGASEPDASTEDGGLECANAFLTVLQNYTMGSYTIQTADTGAFYYLYGIQTLFFGVYFAETDYVTLVQQYIDASPVPFVVPSYFVVPTPAAATPSTDLYAQTLQMPQFLYPLYYVKGIPKDNEIYTTGYDCFTGYDASYMSDADIMSTAESCAQLSCYYPYYPDEATTGPIPNVTITYTYADFFSYLGTCFATEESRTQLATVFLNYVTSCPNAPESIQWQAFVQSTIAASTQTVTVEVSESAKNKYIVDFALSFIKQLLTSESYVQSTSFISVIMSTYVGTGTVYTPTPYECGTYDMYVQVFTAVATSAGFTEWDVYLTFMSDFATEFSGCTTTISFTLVESWFIRFFSEVCCGYTSPPATVLPVLGTTLAPIVVTVPVEISSTPELGTTPAEELSTLAFETATPELTTSAFEYSTVALETTPFVEYTTPEVESTPFVEYDTTPSEILPTIPVPTPSCSVDGVDKCTAILGFDLTINISQLYFRYVGLLFSSSTYRNNFNGKCKQFSEANPSASSSERAGAFVHGVSGCMKEGSGESSTEPSDDDQNESFSYFLDFSIEVFLVGNFELLEVAACDLLANEHLIQWPTSSAVQPTVSPTCDDLYSPNGIFIFFEFIAFECGFSEQSWFINWFIEFKAIYLSFSVDINWSEFEWNWSIDWCSLILEFLEAIKCGCEPPPAPLPTGPLYGSFDIYRFVNWFCLNEEYRVKFEAFMSWYFYTEGYVMIEDVPSSELVTMYNLFFEYMIICVNNPDTPIKVVPSGAPSITVDVFFYTLEYQATYSQSSEFVTLVETYGAQTYDLCPGAENVATFAAEAPTSGGAESMLFTVRYMAVCQGVWESYKFQQIWTQFTYGVQVAEDLSSESDREAQFQILMSYVFQCMYTMDFTGTTPFPSTTADPLL